MLKATSNTGNLGSEKIPGGVGKGLAEAMAQSGHYYRLMMEHVKRVLGDIKRVCPVYDEKQGFEVAGFVWLQGWNDMVNRDVYPISKKDGKEPRYAGYSRWMAGGQGVCGDHAANDEGQSSMTDHDYRNAAVCAAGIGVKCSM